MEGYFFYNSKYSKVFRMPENMLPPPQLYRYIPSKDSIKICGQRMIFYGDVEYSKEERKQSADFMTYLKANKLTLPFELNFPMSIRFLQGTKFDHKKAYQALLEYHQTRLKELPVIMDQSLLEALEKGFLRICGRDRKYRPILIFTPRLAIDEFDKIELFKNLCKFVLETIIHYMMIPGKIENWVVLYDYEGLGLFSLPISFLKEILGLFQNLYNGRMAMSFVLSASIGLRILYAIGSPFISPITKEKIRFFSEPDPPMLFEYIHPSQVMTKFGGTFKCPEKAWPPVFPPQTYVDDPSKITLPEEAFQTALKKSISLFPSPVEGDAVRAASDLPCGLFPRKTYYLTSKIERRDSFNAIISEESYETVGSEEEKKVYVEDSLLTLPFNQGRDIAISGGINSSKVLTLKREEDKVKARTGCCSCEII